MKGISIRNLFLVNNYKILIFSDKFPLIKNNPRNFQENFHNRYHKNQVILMSFALASGNMREGGRIILEQRSQIFINLD
jgi:hypothetical protein